MIEVIYKDSNVLVVNKPPGLVVFHENNSSIKEDSLSSLLLRDFPDIKNIGGERNGAVHRLDKDTSGVLLFARNEKTLSFLQEQLLEQNAKKRYITLVFKVIKKDKGEITTFIERSPKDRRKQKAHLGPSGKREATTFFNTIKRFENHSLLEVMPKTGRKHQIRCHLSFLGHPVAGDKLYRFKDQLDPKELKRQFLHAESIEVEIPGGEKKIFRANLSTDLQKVLDGLS